MLRGTCPRPSSATPRTLQLERYRSPPPALYGRSCPKLSGCRLWRRGLPVLLNSESSLRKAHSRRAERFRRRSTRLMPGNLYASASLFPGIGEFEERALTDFEKEAAALI